MKGIEQFLQVDAATLGALKYAGTWNASTNTPTLASGVGVQGQYYVVSVAGTTNLDGVTNWGVGDWAVFNGSVWQRVEGGADGNFAELSVTGTAEFADGLAASPSITNIGDTNTGLYFPSADAIAIVTGGVNRLRVTSAGDIGIGTTSPASKLDVNGTVTATGATVTGNTYLATTSGDVGVGTTSATAIYGKTLQVGSGTSEATTSLVGSTGSVFLATVGATGQLIARGGMALVLGANDVERMRITSAGDVGIGTSSPQGLLDVRKDQVAATRIIANNQNATNGASTNFDYYYGTTRLGGLVHGFGSSGAYWNLDVWNGSAATTRMTVDSSGNVGIGTSSPGSKLHVNGDVRFGNGTALGVISYSSTDIYFANLVSGGALTWYTNGAERMRIDSSGNLGLGVTPSAWNANFRAYQAGSAGYAAFVGDQSNGRAEVLNNCYASGASTYTYSQSLGATRYSQQLGVHAWYTAGSGTAGNAISFIQAMTLDASGNLGLGTTSPASIGSSITTLDVTGLNGGGIYLSRTAATATSGYLVALSDEVRLSASTASPLTLFTNNTERMRIDSSGNLGLGVTPSAWSTGRAFEFGAVGNALWGYSGNTILSQNTAGYSGSFLYATTAAASRYQQNAGSHTWYTAPSGTAGNAISFTQAMTLDASGNLGVGTSSPGARLHINSGGVDEVARFEGSGEPFISLYDNGVRDFYLFDSTEIRLWGQANKAMVFATNNTERARIPAAGGMVVGTAAIATNATDGFLYVPTCAGTPTGTPTTQTGTAPIVIDTTNNKLYFYSGGQWRDAGP